MRGPQSLGTDQYVEFCMNCEFFVYFKQNTEQYLKLYFRRYFYNGNYIQLRSKKGRLGICRLVGQLQCVQWTEKRERLKTIKFLIMKIYFYLQIVSRFYKTFLYFENYKLFQSSELIFDGLEVLQTLKFKQSLNTDQTQI